MSTTYPELKESAFPELKELTRTLMAEEPPEIRKIRTGTLTEAPGSYDQSLSTWDFANDIVRDYSMNLYQLLRLAHDDSLSIENMLTVFQMWDPIYSGYPGYSGFPTLADYAHQLRTPGADRREFVDRLATFTEYVNRLSAWSHHYFPWHVGEHHRHAANRLALRQDYMPAPATVEEEPSRRIPIRLTWEPLGLSVDAELACDLNEQLCEDVLASLPFTVLQDHAVVSGESMYAWAPLVSVAPTPVTERICDAPPGRLRFSQATGNKLIVQYGPTTETLRAPVLGRVIDEHIDRLPEVGRAVWESTFRTKDLIWITAERR